MKETINHIEWDGVAISFAESIRGAYRLMMTNRKGSLSLSQYGVLGHGDHYDDFLKRIDGAIHRLTMARELFLKAEAKRKQIDIN